MTALWVSTDPTPDGVYRVNLMWGPDQALVLDQETAMAHAREVLNAAAEAEYDAAVAKQLRARGVDHKAVVQMVLDLRAERPEVPPPTPMSLTPGVSAFTGQPFIGLHMHGKQIGQWSPDDARDHAVYVLMSLRVAELDSAYLRGLRAIGLDDSTARAVVGDLATHRDDFEERPW